MSFIAGCFPNLWKQEAEDEDVSGDTGGGRARAAWRLRARGKADVRKLKHAQILLKGDEPGWDDERNAAGTTIDWQFTTEGARVELRSLHPSFHA